MISRNLPMVAGLLLPASAYYVSALVGQPRRAEVDFLGPRRVPSQVFSSLGGSSDYDLSATSDLAGPALPPIEPTTKRLFLVRHGEVVNPGEGRPVFYGAMDVSLSPLGESEAKAAAAYLQQFDLEYVVSSPLSRAVFGANEVCSAQQDLKNNLVVLDGFKELDRGSWCGKTGDEIGADLLARFDGCDESVTPDGGESYPFVKKRVLEARDEVLGMLSPGRAAAVVSHLQVTRSMLSDAMDVPTNEMAGLKVLTASVTCVDFDLSTGTQTVHFHSFKPDVGLAKSNEGVYN
jgi:broad specificity phosphatase PhoE